MVSMDKYLICATVCFLVISQSGFSTTGFGPQPPTDLRCQYVKRPMGLDTKEPVFSWIPEHTERGQVQTAYRLLVSTNPVCAEGDMWDSGQVKSERTAFIRYEGKVLESNTSYYWKIKYWDKEETESEFSKAACFETGLLDIEKDWKASWITKHNQLRKEFELEASPVRARAFVSGLGYYELRINGNKVGENVLDPGWTTYDKRVLYTAYDVTGLLKKGKNALGAVLGKGWYKSQAFIFQLHIEMDSGEDIVFFSDENWASKAGPIVSDSIYNGEIYDARLETEGWDRPGFDDSGWDRAELAISPQGLLIAQIMPPIQVIDTILPLKVTHPAPGVFIYDMGQNMSGWARLRVRGPAGTKIRLRFAELLYEDGTLNRENLRKARAEDVYICKGDGFEEFEPRFTYHGFRYVELTGFPGIPGLDALHGRVVHTAVEQTGTFTCSNPLLNRLQHNILWGQKTNLHSIPSDCSQRDERMGWLGDAHLTAEEAIFNFDMGAFYTKFIDDIRDVQDKKGTLTDTVPHIWGSRPADPAWGTAYPLLCWYLYRMYGDTAVLEDHYEGLKKYVDFLRSASKDDLLQFSHYGDWVSIEKTPGGLVSSFYYAYNLDLLAKIAGVLKKSSDAKSYGQFAEKARNAFHQRYYDEAAVGYGSNTQTANVLALFLGGMTDGQRGGAMGNLVNDILYRNDTHLTTGIIGTKYLMDVLHAFGRNTLAYELASQTTYPSWGYMIVSGATTLWELWQNKTGPEMNSHNHPMFGSVGAWFYRALAGINQ
ncbi:MAG: family 78 glycoside hydrolase catalytic domain, partial [Acidobacteria bacterium]|nr:family 78 glycoside hydrolase catalytic domain [Acidobacteriota bacterium]